MADVIFVGNDSRSTPIKYRDMGDGTWARVIYNATPTGASLLYTGERSQRPRKLKDLGDGSFAPTVAGVNF